MLALILLLQAASPPDIELNARATVRDVRIQRQGQASLQVRATPDGGSTVTVDAPPAAGRHRLRNVTVNVHAEARIAASQPNPATQETLSPE